jgi:hypothetical protein
MDSVEPAVIPERVPITVPEAAPCVKVAPESESVPRVGGMLGAATVGAETTPSHPMADPAVGGVVNV